MVGLRRDDVWSRVLRLMAYERFKGYISPERRRSAEKFNRRWKDAPRSNDKSFLPRGSFLPTASPSALPLASSSSSPDLRIPGIRTLAFGAFQIRRPSGRFQGILNVAAVVVDVSDFGSLAGFTAIGYHDLMGKKSSNRRKHRQKCMSEGKLEAGEDSSVDDSCGGDFTEMSDGGESTTSTSSAASAAASPRILREMNGQELNQNDCVGGGILCWLGLPRKIHISPSDENFRVLCSSEKFKRL